MRPGVRLVSRNGKDLTRRFPELAAAVAALKPPTLLLDGEIAVFDSQLISHFEWIRAQPKDEPATPPTLIAFDCLYTRGRISGSDGSGCDGTCSRSLSMISS
jgi:bifunctional non-homologous end joining protein LigD